MAAFSRRTCISVALVAFASACLTSFSEAADMSRAPERGVVVSATSAPGATARQIAEIQQRLLGVMGTQIDDQAVEALAASLVTVRGSKESAAPMAALARAVSQVLAKGALADDELERLAQDLYVASSNRMLPDRDAGLLAIDVATLLHEVGAEAPAVAAVLTALQGICPGAKMPPTVTVPQGETAPAPRKLSVLSRQTDS